MIERVVLRNLFGPTQDLSKLPWQAWKPGVDIVRLYGDGEHGAAAALLKYAAGASVPRHGHEGYEHIMVLAGSQGDDNGTYEAGTCLIHGTDTAHSVVSAQGCVVLAIWNTPVRFVDNPGIPSDAG